MGEGNEPLAGEALAPPAAQHDESQPRLITSGERWRARVLTTLAQRTLGQSARRFSAAHQNRYRLPRTQLVVATATKPGAQESGSGLFPAPPLPALPEGEGFAALVQPKQQVAPVGSSAPLPVARMSLRDKVAHASPVRSQSPAPWSGRQVGNVQPLPPRRSAPLPAADQTSALPPSVAPPLGSQELAGVEESLPSRLDGRIQSWLNSVLGIRIPAVKLYVNQAADKIARDYHADAVSIGDKILFRSGKFDPTSPAGLGLLGHELTHAAQARLAEPAGLSAGTPTTHRTQELTALRNEERVMQQFAAPAALPLAPPMPAGAATSDRPAPITPGGHSLPAQPRTAATDRPTADAGPAGPTVLLTEQQIKQIKDVVYQDLMARIRTEFERGG